jgi:hypothetical protein
MEHRSPSSPLALSWLSSVRRRSVRLPRDNSIPKPPSSYQNIAFHKYGSRLSVDTLAERSSCSAVPYEQDIRYDSALPPYAGTGPLSAPTWEADKVAFWARFSRRNTRNRSVLGHQDDDCFLRTSRESGSYTPLPRLPTSQFEHDDDDYGICPLKTSDSNSCDAHVTFANPSPVMKGVVQNVPGQDGFPPEVRSKFTLKWPAPLLSGSKSRSFDSAWTRWLPLGRHDFLDLYADSEYWKVSKWCLLFSAMSILVYGLFGMFCVLSTSFDCKHPVFMCIWSVIHLLSLYSQHGISPLSCARPTVT